MLSQDIISEAYRSVQQIKKQAFESLTCYKYTPSVHISNVCVRNYSISGSVIWNLVSQNLEDRFAWN